jgi:hypothetical protein
MNLLSNFALNHLYLVFSNPFKAQLVLVRVTRCVRTNSKLYLS